MNCINKNKGLGRRSKTKGDDMADLYKKLGDLIVSSINKNWSVAVVKITSSLRKMCEFDCSFSKDGNKFERFDFDRYEGFDLGYAVFELQESMYPEHKWNRAVYTLEKNGHFDMEFIWDQALQDEWDK